jgi:hypothetical protein
MALSARELRELSVSLEVTKPFFRDGTHEITGVATVKQINKPQPETQYDIEFLRNGDLMEADSTDNSGQATTMINIEHPGNYIIIARIKDSTIQASRRVSVAPYVLKPASFAVHVSGQNGNYNLLVQVHTAEDVPVPGLEITVMDPYDSRRVFTLENPTDSQGFARHDVTFTERKRLVKFIVPFISEARIVSLLGPN